MTTETERIATFKKQLENLSCPTHVHEPLDPPWDNFEWIRFSDSKEEKIVVEFKICKHCGALFAVAAQ
jgi:hypothetical protein